MKCSRSMITQTSLLKVIKIFGAHNWLPDGASILQSTCLRIYTLLLNYVGFLLLLLLNKKIMSGVSLRTNC